MKKERTKKGIIRKELKHHIPFTALATVIAILVVLVFLILKIDFSETLFEILHPAHVIFSAFATSAIFFRYKKSITKALLVGITGAIIIGSLSDIIFPWLGATLLNTWSSIFRKYFWFINT
jgi:hypothetical protein